MVSTNDDIEAYGFDGDWLMIAYRVNSEAQQTRIGYIHKDDFRRELLHYDRDENYEWYSIPFTQLSFSQIQMSLAENSVLTDDPEGVYTPLATLKAGETVTLLMDIPPNGWASDDAVHWAYVEYSGEKPMRGFLPLNQLK